MGTPTASQAPGRNRIRLAVVFLGVGLLGHVLAARAIGGSRVAYTHHVLGFFIILLVSGSVVLLLGRRFWPGRHDLTGIIVGALQALFGVLIYAMEAG